MARINFEDDVEAQDEFWRLLELIGGDRDKALGRLLRFFRIAQKAWGRGEPMSGDDLRSKGFSDMIESGWAVPFDEGFHALGAKKHFEWYRQKVEAAKKGGEARSEKFGFGRNVPIGSRSGAETDFRQAELDSASPLAPVPAPVPALALSPVQKTNTNARACVSEHIQDCIQEWEATLKHFEIGRPIGERDEVAIGQAVQRYGADWVKLAFLGARKQTKGKTFDPKNFVSLSIYLHRDRIERLVNIGAGKESADGVDWTKVFGSEVA